MGVQWHAAKGWGWDGDAKSVYIADSSTCLDLYEVQDWDAVQDLHVWECNGLVNQEWDLFDSPAPSGYINGVRRQFPSNVFSGERPGIDQHPVYKTL